MIFDSISRVLLVVAVIRVQGVGGEHGGGGNDDNPALPEYGWGPDGLY